MGASELGFSQTTGICSFNCIFVLSLAKSPLSIILFIGALSIFFLLIAAETLSVLLIFAKKQLSFTDLFYWFLVFFICFNSDLYYYLYVFLPSINLGLWSFSSTLKCKFRLRFHVFWGRYKLLWTSLWEMLLQPIGMMYSHHYLSQHLKKKKSFN